MKVGLALGGGAARGLAHIGVLEVLEKEGIYPDMIAGTSAGALIGAIYAQGNDAGSITRLALDVGSRRLASLIDLALPRTGLIRGRKIRGLLESFISSSTQFSDLRIPFACVAADIETGGEVVIKQGSVLEGVIASIAIPIIFAVVKQQGKYLVDGGLANPVPVRVVKEMGADFVIAVNVIPDISKRAQHLKGSKEPNIFHVAMQSLYFATHSLVMTSLQGADVVIAPQVAHISYGDFHRVEELILQGKLAAQDRIPEIKKLLAV